MYVYMYVCTYIYIYVYTCQHKIVWYRLHIFVRQGCGWMSVDTHTLLTLWNEAVPVVDAADNTVVHGGTKGRHEGGAVQRK